MTSVTYSTLYSAPSENIYNILNTRTNVADPRDSTGARKFVFNSEPKPKAIDTIPYPCIIVEDALVSMPENQRADHEREVMVWTQNIIVRVANDGAGNNRPNTGITDMRNIVNSIVKTFKDSTIKSTLRGYNMYDVQISVTNVDTATLDQLYLHETTLEIEYRTDIKVTA